MQAGSDTCLDVGFWKLAGYFVGCLPARTVPWYQNSWPDSSQLCNSARDNRLENAPGEMQSANKCVDRVYTCQSPCMPQDIDHSRVAATREHNEPFVL